jgi:hypothetical protein
MFTQSKEDGNPVICDNMNKPGGHYISGISQAQKDIA